LAASFAASLMAAPDPVISSEWKSRDLQVDGRIEDWSRLTVLDKGPAVAVANDAEFLYLVVSATDPDMRRTLQQGLVIWFDPSGMKKPNLGYQLPAMTHGRGFGPGSDNVDPDSAAALPASIDELDVLGPGQQRHLVPLNPVLDVVAASAMDRGAVVFEMKLPLETSAGHPYAVNAKAGASLSLGIVTPDPPKGGSGGGGRGRIGGGGGGGGYGGRGGGGGRGGSSGGFNEARVNPIKIWVKLQLATH
jgi:hypothetical protein